MPVGLSVAAASQQVTELLFGYSHEIDYVSAFVVVPTACSVRIVRPTLPGDS
jgi:hypothetical protein